MNWILAVLRKWIGLRRCFQCVATEACGHVHSSAMPQLSRLCQLATGLSFGDENK